MSHYATLYKKIMCYTKHHIKYNDKFIWSYSILDWFDSLSCQSGLGISKIWEIAKHQIDSKENADLVNEQYHKTFYYLILLNDTTSVWRFFAWKVHLILKVWLNVSNQYIRGTTSVQVSTKPTSCSGNFP